MTHLYLVKAAISIILLSLFSYSSMAQFECGDDFTDQRDGKNYRTILVANQCWMADNLNFGIMLEAIDGDDFQTDNNIHEKYCYENDSNYCNIYGGLYQWDEIMNYTEEENSRGLCPEGWSLPSKSDFDSLESYLGIDSAAYYMQYGDIGFDALAAGYCYFNYTNWVFGSINGYGVLRTSTSVTTDNEKAWVKYFYPNTPELMESDYYKKSNGYSVRCIKDSVIPSSIGRGINRNIQPIKIFPNPAVNHIIIGLPIGIQCSIHIINSSGKTIISQVSQSSKEIKIDVGQLNNGLYIVLVKSSIFCGSETLIVPKLT